MISHKLLRPAGFAVGAGTALTAFGIVQPAHATVDCSAGVTVDADELEIREAIAAGETLICVNPGTIDLSSNGFEDATGIGVDDQDLHLVALGEVILDGGNESRNAILLSGASDENLTVDGFTIRNFYNFGGGSNTLGLVSMAGSSGTLTVLNSTFTSNVGYSVVSNTDSESGDAPSIRIDNSYFSGNNASEGTIAGYGSIEVTNSTFVGEDNDGGVINARSVESPVTVSGNYFEDNSSSNGIINLNSTDNSVYNNTFVENFSNSDEDGSVLTFQTGSDGIVAFNTFSDNDSDYELGNVHAVADNDVALYGNVFETFADEGALTGTDPVVTDGGGNISTSSLDEGYFTNSSSKVGVTAEEIALGSPADNGGATWTMALGAESVARDVVEASVVAVELGSLMDVDQRGDSRGDLLDAGAWDDGGSGLANTGVDALGIAMAGGVLGAAGAALIARRRRTV